MRGVLEQRSQPVGEVRGQASLGQSAPVELRDVWFGYRKRQPILRGVSLTVPAGRPTMILGASGSGKTTLLRLVKGLLTPGGGEVRVLGERRTAAGPRSRLDPRVAYIPQQLGLVRSLPVLDNVLAGAASRVAWWRVAAGMYPAGVVDEAHAVLARLGIAAKAREKVRSLSGGERQRVAIARALLQHAAVILADEFVSQLDPVTTVEIMELMERITEEGVTLLMTTHELDIVARFAGRVVVLRQGAVALDCPASEAEARDLSALLRP